MRIGLIADTHGLLRAELWDHFTGVEQILHAGDVGPADLLDELATIAPVTAVRGNNDRGDLRARLPEVARMELGGISIAMLHGDQLGSPTPERAAAAYPGVGLVVFGHSHLPVIRRVGPTLAVNPGSAGRARFGRPVTAALAEIRGGSIEVRLVYLAGSASASPGSRT